MTCKDCYHYEACKEKFAGLRKIRVDEPEKHLELNPRVEIVCQQFKDKSRYIEVPCNVGDKIYCDGKYFADHCKGKVMEFIVGDIKTEVCTYFRGEIDMVFRFSDFGKKVFLTRKEAEERLKELNGNE